MYKSQLQEFCQKAGLSPPVYESTREGPTNRLQFQAFVTVGDVKYESAPGYTSRKNAEHAAAKAALEACSKNSSVCPNPVESSGLCKNILQEYTQKMTLPLPIYHTEKIGDAHSPMFSSTVEIAGKFYQGTPEKIKKQAEVKAARAALLAIHAAPRSQGQVGVSLKPSAKAEGTVDVTGSNNGHLEAVGSKKRGRSPDSAPTEIEKVKVANVDNDSAGCGLNVLGAMPLADVTVTTCL